MYVYITNKLVLIHSKIFGNEAQQGGGLYALDTEVEITNSTFYENIAGVQSETDRLTGGPSRRVHSRRAEVSNGLSQKRGEHESQ